MPYLGQQFPRWDVDQLDFIVRRSNNNYVSKWWKLYLIGWAGEFCAQESRSSAHFIHIQHAIGINRRYLIALEWCDDIVLRYCTSNVDILGRKKPQNKQHCIIMYIVGTWWLKKASDLYHTIPTMPTIRLKAAELTALLCPVSDMKLIDVRAS